MDYLSLVGVAVALWILLIPFTSYCVVDSDRPTLPSAWSTFLATQTLLVATGFGAFYFHSNGSKYAFVLTMLFMGMLFAAAAVDPNQIKRANQEGVFSYLKRLLVERLRRVALLKLVVYVSAAIATYAFPKYWYLVLFFVVLHLHYYKMASCIATEAGTIRPQDAPKEVQRKWIWRAVAAGVVMSILIKGPHIVFSELAYIPGAWGAFGGFGLMSATLFLVRVVTHR